MKEGHASLLKGNPTAYFCCREVRGSGLIAAHPCTQPRKRRRLDLGRPLAVLTTDLKK